MNDDELLDHISREVRTQGLPQSVGRWRDVRAGTAVAPRGGRRLRPILLSVAMGAVAVSAVTLVAVRGPGPARSGVAGSASAPALASHLPGTETTAPPANATTTVAPSGVPGTTQRPAGALPSGSPPPGATASAPQKGCFAQPSRCGYPDATNTGVPGGTALRSPSAGPLPAGVTWDAGQGVLTISQAGVTISGFDVPGDIVVKAPNVTIKNTRVTESYADAWAVELTAAATNTLIEDSTIRGQDSGANSVRYAIQNFGGDTNRALRVNLSNCGQCYSGGGTLQDSYVDVTTDSSHSSYDVYYPGGAGRLLLTHNTLVNPWDHEAVVFLDTAFGTTGAVSLSNSLLAGGNVTVVGRGSKGSGDVISGNRFSTHFFPQCGAGASSSGIVTGHTVWSGNYWDESLAALNG